MVALILFWIFYCCMEGYDHARYKSIYHTRSTYRRIALGLLVVYCYCGVGPYYIVYINTGFLLASVFTVFFDIARNLAKGEKWHYIGGTSSIDKILDDHKVAAWSAKFLLMALCIIAHLYHAVYLVHHDLLINTTQWPF